MKRSQKYLLDTNVYSDALKAKKHKRDTPEVYVSRHLRLKGRERIVIPSIAIQETQRGLLNPDMAKSEKARVNRLLSRYKTADFDAEAAGIAARIENDLGYRNSKYPGDLQKDIQIAATAVRYNYILVTRNQKDFQRIQSVCTELKIEDWSSIPLSFESFVYDAVAFIMHPLVELAALGIAIVAWSLVYQYRPQSSLGDLTLHYLLYLVGMASIGGVIWGLAVLLIANLVIAVNKRMTRKP